MVTTLALGCSNRAPSDSKVIAQAAAPTDRESIVRFCADCHALPSSSSFAKDDWKKEVEQGFRLYNNSGRHDLIPTDFEATLKFFRDPAPEQILIPVPVRTTDSQFVTTELSWPSKRLPVSISSIRMTTPDPGSPKFLLSDMWTGALSAVSAKAGELTVLELGEVAHPAHLEPADLDADGMLDYLVADLGTLNPQEEKQGNLWWFRAQADGNWKRMPLRLGMSRVAELQPIDYDQDGDLDLLAGDFGLHFTGSIYLGTNEGLNDGSSKYSWQVIDPRPGTISLPTLDFDGDGRTDFLALIAQQYETVELKLNRGGGKFDTEVIYVAGDPSFGTSSMQVLDFDGDGDVDVLYTNGDTFDDTLAKPYHGIKWLENEGRFPFTVREVAAMPGCYHAVAGDIDGDGDLDIAAVSLLSRKEMSKYPLDTFDGVAWFEQQADGSFLRHTLQKNNCQAATCALTDWDGDGDLDLLVPPSSPENNPSDHLLLFVNQRLQSTNSNR